MRISKYLLSCVLVRLLHHAESTAYTAILTLLPHSVLTAAGHYIKESCLTSGSNILLPPNYDLKFHPFSSNVTAHIKLHKHKTLLPSLMHVVSTETETYHNRTIRGREHEICLPTVQSNQANALHWSIHLKITQGGNLHSGFNLAPAHKNLS